MDKFDKIANALITEAFTTGPFNTTSGDNEMQGKGTVIRQMLSGEWFGAPTLPYQAPTSDVYKKQNELTQDQAQSGQGDHPGTGKYFEGKELVADVLEGSPSAMYSDPDSVGYLINSIRDYGYEKIAEGLEAICEDPTPEGVAFISESIDFLEDKVLDDHTRTKLVEFAEGLITMLETEGGTAAGTTEDAGTTTGGGPKTDDDNTDTSGDVAPTS